LDLEANCQITKREIKYNFENGDECVEITKTSYCNLMLDRRVLKIEEIFARHVSFLPQEVVRHEIWNRGFQKRHNYR
jgi:heterodisulfide reductase subunit B